MTGTVETDSTRPTDPGRAPETGGVRPEGVVVEVGEGGVVGEGVVEAVVSGGGRDVVGEGVVARGTTVQRVVVRYAKRGVLKYSSARDLGRAIERGLRRASIPMAYSQGFHPHPRISFLSAAPTGASSEAEYLELRLAHMMDVGALAAALDSVLPDGVAILTAVDGTDGLAARMSTELTASQWLLTWPDAARPTLIEAIRAFAAAESVIAHRPARGPKPP
ncbi:MAG: TIGR03936 family radical SAM-associated protein, partial [Micrococcales bacterium]|nr:TIGR03936 family radical SAM-associated protein [Micrococcales bacterium]